MKKTYQTTLLFSVIIMLSACQFTDVFKPAISTEPVTIVFYDWENDVPDDVFEEFTRQTGILVEYQTYDSDIDAEDTLIKGDKQIDVAVLDNDAIPYFIQNNLLHKIKYENIPNFRYISIDFRDLAFDPDNRYSVPFNWGSTGLIVLNSNEMPKLQHWSDLWLYADDLSIGMRGDLPFDNLAVGKMTLGYSINECDPENLNLVMNHLQTLLPSIIFIPSDSIAAVDDLESGKINVLIGWSDDVFEAQDRGLNISYIIPDEGTFLWGDSFVIASASNHAPEAEQLINYLLEPAVAAKILLYNNYANANVAMNSLVPDEYLSDGIIYPSEDVLWQAEIYQPISQSCSDMQTNLWNEFVDQTR